MPLACGRAFGPRLCRPHPSRHGLILPEFCNAESAFQSLSASFLACEIPIRRDATFAEFFQDCVMGYGFADHDNYSNLFKLNRAQRLIQKLVDNWNSFF
jgi:hypothetical protein